jgi:uncharacterized membrane protein YfcA
MWSRTDQRRATGTSLAAILPIALVAAGAYYFGSATPQADLPVAAALVIGGAGGVVVGALVALRISERALRVVVAILLFVVALKDLHDAVFGASLAAGSSSLSALTWQQYLLIAVCGLGIGVISGLGGLGGGVFIVPLLVIAFGVPQRIAQGTSLIAILPTAAIGALIHEANGEVDVRAASAIGAAGVPTAIAGSLLALLVPQRTLLGLFGLFLVFAAARTWPLWPPTRGA